MTGVVVVVGEGGVKSLKKSSVMGTEVGTKKVTSRLFVEGSETMGCNFTVVSSVSCCTCSGIRMPEMVCESESSSLSGEGELGLQVSCLTSFFGV